MPQILSFFNQFKKYFVTHVLYTFVIWILEIDLGKEKILPRKIVSHYQKLSLEYPTPSLDPDLPKALTDISPSSNYLQLLKIAQEKGNPIKPVRHRKEISKTIFCPSCGAPYTYISSNAVIKVKHRSKPVQKYRCKICSRQWFPPSQKVHAIFYCPFCRTRLSITKTRQEYDIFICRNKSCDYLKQKSYCYIYRDYFFNVHELVLASPVKSPIDLSRIHYSYNVLGLALVLHVNFRLPYRRTSDFLEEIFGVSIASSTLYNWIESVAHLLAPLVTKLPISTSNILVADETYERYAGSWGYYYACLDAINRYLVAPHFSPKRNVKAVATCLTGALKRIKNPPPTINIVHDYYPPYFLAVQLINQSNIFPFKLVSLPVKGLKDEHSELPNFNRRYKNIIERYFGTAKPLYYMTRGFGTLAGAVSHHILHAIDYNYFHPHQYYKFEPPIKIQGLKSNHPIEKWNKLIQMARRL